MRPYIVLHKMIHSLIGGQINKVKTSKTKSLEIKADLLLNFFVIPE